MAYINLLPPEDRKIGLNVQQSAVMGGIVIYLFLLIGVYFWNSYAVRGLKQEYAGLENQLKMSQPALKRLGELEKVKKTLEERVKASLQLAGESRVAERLVLISELIPPTVTLSRLNLGETSIAFEGESLDFTGVADFLAALKASEEFVDLELISSFTNEISGGTIGFKIMGKVKVKG